jgi:hypothetical protein
MLGIQLNLDGEKLVTCGGVVLGVATPDKNDDNLGVLRILVNEYAEQCRMIKDGLTRNRVELNWLNSVSIVSGQILITVRWEQRELSELLELYCFPMKIDNLVITYVPCKKTYTVKLSSLYIKKELKRLDVIK